MPNSINHIPTVLKTEKKSSFFVLLGKSALIFVAFALVAVFVSWAFGWIAFESHSSADLYSKIVNGRSDTRRMAAAEWARTLLSAEQKSDGAKLDRLRPDAYQTKTLLIDFQNQKKVGAASDPVLGGALATILGFSTEPSAAILGLEAYLEGFDPSSSVEPLLYTLVSLARLNSTSSRSLALIIQAAEHPDPAVKKAATFALGAPLYRGQSVSIEALQKLRTLLTDENLDVRWNAAFALARVKDQSARPIVAQLLEEIQLGTGPEMNIERFQAYKEAFKAARALGDDGLLARLKEISENHLNLKVRQAAKEEVSK